MAKLDGMKMWITWAKIWLFWHHNHVNTVEELSQKVREVISLGSSSVDLAIARVVDQAFEAQAFQAHDESRLKLELKRSLVGLGALEELIQDPEIEEIWLNAPNKIFASSSGKTQKIEIEISQVEVRQLVERMLRESGRRLDRAEPFVDATLADGSRLHVVIPDVTKSDWAVNIRKFPRNVMNLDELVKRGSISAKIKDILASEFLKGTNILVSGATQAGKTSLLCAILDLGAETERLVSVEETFEIKTNYVDFVALQARQANLEGVGEISLRRLVREALRMRPTRIVVGEVRQAEALDLLIALNSGIAGLCTIHANSASEALEKLKLLPLLAGENIPAKFVEDTVERTIGLVVHCHMNSQGMRRVTEVIRNVAGKWERLAL